MTQILLRYTAHCNNFILIFVLYKNINANARGNITSGRIGFNVQEYSERDNLKSKTFMSDLFCSLNVHNFRRMA